MRFTLNVELASIASGHQVSRVFGDTTLQNGLKKLLSKQKYKSFVHPLIFSTFARSQTVRVVYLVSSKLDMLENCGALPSMIEELEILKIPLLTALPHSKCWWSPLVSTSGVRVPFPGVYRS
jgi:hypothetical protein